MIRISLLVLLFLSNSLYSQDREMEPCNFHSKLYKDYKRYIPEDDFPILTLKLNFIFLQRDDGCCGFSKDNAEHVDVISKSIEFINNKYSRLKDPETTVCYKGDDFIPDAKIRFVLNEIIEVQDDFLWNLDNGGYCPNDRTWYLNKIDSVLFKDPRYTNCINVYMPNQLSSYEKYVLKTDTLMKPKTVYDCSQLPSMHKLKRSSKLNMTNKLIKYYKLKYEVVNDTTLNPHLYTWDESIYYWYWSTLAIGLTHELGHTLGLMHSNEHHGANKCEYSIMHQKHGFPKNYLPPTEIGKIHRSMRLTNIREFLYEEVYSPIPWIIDKDTQVDLNYKVYEDILVKSGTTLSVSCHLEMSPMTTIYLEPGATLDLTEGTISGVRDLGWQGVTVIQKKKCFLRKKRQITIDPIINPSNMTGHKKVVHYGKLRNK